MGVDTFRPRRGAHTRRESRNPSPKHDDRGAVVARWVRCGKPWCRCANGGPKHGPYYTRYWREGGRRRKEYIPLADVQARREACDRRRLANRQLRWLIADRRGTWSRLFGALREYERLWRAR
jgi:hypothetical protein